MARRISWLPRISEIRRSVRNSARTHYDRHELERLFEVQPRSAQMLLELMPTTTLGRSLLVEREALARFLEGLDQADNVSVELERLRAAKQVKPANSLRYIVTDEIAHTAADSLPANLTVEPGRLEIRFSTITELAEGLHAVAAALSTDLDSCVRLWEPPNNSEKLIV